MNSHRLLCRAALAASLLGSVFSLTPASLSAQERGSAEATGADAGAFYKAFYLARGARRFDQAAIHYRKFLVAQPEHALAATAARELHALLLRTGKHKEAAAARKEFGSLFRVTIDTPAKEAEKKDSKKAGKAKGVSREAAASKAGGRAKVSSAKPSPEMAQRIARLTKELEAAKSAGDDQRALMLEAQLERAKKRAGGGGRSATSTAAKSGGRAAGGIAARAGQVDFSKMDDAAAAQMIERIEAMRDRVVQRLDEKTREQVDVKWAALRKHLDGGDKAGAQKLWVELRTMLFRRR